MTAGYSTTYYHGVEHGSHVDEAGRTVIAKYSEVMEALRSPDFASDSALVVRSLLPRSLRDRYTAIERFYSSWFVHKDGEEHKTSRRNLNPAFNEAIKFVAPTAQRVCSRMLRSLAGKGTFDFVKEYAKPYPIYLTNVLFGIVEDDWYRMLLHSDRIAKFAVGQSGMNIMTTLKEADESLAFMNEYFDALLLSGGQTASGGSFIDCIKSIYDEASVEEKELIRSQIPMLYFGGYTTISRHLSVTLRTIVIEDICSRKSEARERYENRDIKELLRYDSPLQMIPRMTVRPTRVGGLDIPENSKVLLHLGAANKDEAKFSNPHHLDLSRDEGGHLALGVGAHSCIGGSLAYLQSKTTFNNLLDDYTVHLEDVPTKWEGGDMMRGLETLPLRIEAA